MKSTDTEKRVYLKISWNCAVKGSQYAPSTFCQRRFLRQQFIWSPFWFFVSGGCFNSLRLFSDWIFSLRHGSGGGLKLVGSGKNKCEIPRRLETVRFSWFPRTRICSTMRKILRQKYYQRNQKKVGCLKRKHPQFDAIIIHISQGKSSLDVPGKTVLINPNGSKMSQFTHELIWLVRMRDFIRLNYETLFLSFSSW